MNCKDIDHKIVDFVDNKLSVEESITIQNHIDSCDSCKQIHNETLSLMAAFQSVELEKPSGTLRQNFLNMLDEEKQLQSPKVVQLHSKSTIKWKQAFQIAASVVLVCLGFFAGSYSSKQQASEEIAILKEQTTELKENMMLALIDNRSASKRIQAVNYSEELSQPDSEVLEALINRMHYDSNINVRLAAADALSKYSEKELIKKAFIDALEQEENPDLQIAIIQFLVKIQDKRALEPMQHLLDKPETPDFVKAQANSGISQII